MRLPFVPAPSDVVHAVEGLRGGFAELLAAVPRVVALVGRAEELVGRVDAVVERAEGLVERGAGLVERAEELVERGAGLVARTERTVADVGETQRRADEAVTAVGETQRRADEAVTAVGGTVPRAGDALTRAEAITARVDPLLEQYQEPLLALVPAVRRLATTLEPAEVEAVVTFVDRLPRLVVHLDEDVLPVLESLDNVGQDVHELLDTMQDLRQVVKGFPGSRLLRRRGAEEIAEDEQENVRADDQEPAAAGS